MRRRYIIAILIASLLVLAAISVFTYRTLNAPKTAVPETIDEKLTFSPLVPPTDSEDYVAKDFSFQSVEDGTKLLTYIIETPSGNVTVTEYTQPTEFVDVPDYKTQFLNNVIKQYATVQTSNGAIYLGRAAKQDNKQLGIMLERGLIIFFSPDKEMDEAAWRRLGEQLELHKVSN